MHNLLLLPSSLAFLVAVVAGEYVWPSFTDSMEDLLYLQSGYIKNGALSDRTFPIAIVFILRS